MLERGEIVSGGSSLRIAPERWTSRVPPKWRQRVPHYVGSGELDGTVGIIQEDRRDRAGRRLVTPELMPTFEVRAAAFSANRDMSADDRLRDQDQNGLDGEILFTDPYSPVFLGMVASHDPTAIELLSAHPIWSGFWRCIREDEAYKAIVRAYNAYLAQEYCSSNPDRLVALGVIPDTGVEDAISELECCLRDGLKGVALHRFPSGKGYPTPEDDLFWRVALQTRMPVACRITTGTTLPTHRQTSQYWWEPASHTWTDASVRRATALQDQTAAAVAMAYGGVFDRFPSLQIYWPGSQLGWLSSHFQEVDEQHERHRYSGKRFYWGESFRGIESMEREPSYYLKTNCYWGFMVDPYAVEARHRIGVHHLIWTVDTASLGRGRSGLFDALSRSFGNVPDGERYRMLAGNAIEFFHLDGSKDTADGSLPNTQHRGASLAA